MSHRELRSSRFDMLGRLVAMILWTLTGVAAAVLSGRAIAGAFDEVVHGLIPCLAATIGLVASLMAWQLYVHCAVSMTEKQQLLTGLCSLASPAAIGFSTSLSASPISVGVMTGILLLGLVAVTIQAAMKVRIGPSNIPLPIPASGPQVTARQRSRDDDRPIREVDPAESVEDMEGSNLEIDPSILVQQFTRFRDPGGLERIEATLAATLPAGERVVAIHLPIHPVLNGTLDVECEPLDDSDVTVAVTTVQPYGLRLEVKRNEGLHESLTVPVGVAVSADGQVVNVA